MEVRPQLGVRQRRERHTLKRRKLSPRAIGPVVPHYPHRQVSETLPEHRRRPSPVVRERATKSLAYDARPNRFHLLVGERNGCRSDGISVELFKITLNGNLALCRRLFDIVVCIWRRRGRGEGGVVAQRWKHGVMVFHKNKYQEECDNHKGILLVAYAGKTLLKVIARRISEYCEHVGILPGGPAGGTKWFPTAPLYHRCDVRDSSATRVGVGENSVVCMLYPPYQSVRLR